MQGVVLCTGQMLKRCTSSVLYNMIERPIVEGGYLFQNYRYDKDTVIP